MKLSKAEDRFKWFLASILFAKRISAEIAKKTFRILVGEGLTTPKKIIYAGWHRLVEFLDSGGYARYDYSTASNILSIMNDLLSKYGDLESIHEQATDPRDLEARLKQFRGVGPVCINIFLREFRGIWVKAKPAPSILAVEMSKVLAIPEFERYESGLVRLRLEYCRKNRCYICPVKAFCSGGRTFIRG